MRDEWYVACGGLWSDPRVRVLQTDHLVADGANDPLCFEIRNLEVCVRRGGEA